MSLRIYDFDRGNESYDMIMLVHHAGSIRLKRAKELVEKLLSREIDSIELECSDADGDALLEKISSLGFVAEKTDAS